MESFFSSLKTERTARRTYRTRNEARADVFDYIERFYNAIRRHSTIGCLSPVEFERRWDQLNVLSTKPAAAQTDRQPFRPTVPRTIVHGVRSADVVPTALVNIARSCTVALTPCFPSQRRPRASCLRSFRSWPTGSLRARRSASAACRMSGDETGSGSSGRILRSSLAMEGIFVGYCLSPDPDRMPRL
jgi:Integrase core domain